MSAGALNFSRFMRSTLLSKARNCIKVCFSDKYLVYTNVSISMLLSGVGDVIEQHYEILTKDLQGYSMTRTRNMSVSGITTGIITHNWYKLLDRRLPGSTMRIIIKKILCDQLLCSPVTVTCFFVTVGIMEGQSKEAIAKEFRDKALKLYMAEWVVWPPAQFINFYFVPLKFRVLYDNIISLGYDVYNSYIKHQPSDEDS